MGVLVSHTVLLQSADAASDAQLVARAIEGDRWGREMLYRRHAAYLLAIAARLLGNRNEGEEVVQDTFVTAFEQLRTLREPAALRGWLAQIAVSLVRRRMRAGACCACWAWIAARTTRRWPRWRRRARIPISAPSWRW